MKFKVALAIVSLFLYSCPPASPRYGCYYWINFTGTVKDSGNNLIEGGQLRTSWYPESSLAITSTNAVGLFSFTGRSYNRSEGLYFIFSKAGFQSQNSAALTALEENRACDRKVEIVRDITLVP